VSFHECIATAMVLMNDTTNNVYSTENLIMSRVICHIIKSICIDIQIKLDIESILQTLLLSYTFDFLLDDLIICSIASHISSGTFFN